MPGRRGCMGAAGVYSWVLVRTDQSAVGWWYPKVDFVRVRACDLR